MEKYIISLDLDNTLLDHKKRISRKTIRYFHKLIKQGHMIILNSGRPYQGIIKYSKLMKISHPFIFNDGAGICYLNNNQEIISKELYTIDKEIIKEIYLKNIDSIEAINIYEFNDQYYNDKSKIPFWMFHEGDDIKYHEGDIDVILDKDPISISLDIKEEKIDSFKKDLEKYKEEISYFDWGIFGEIHAFEIFKKGVSKALTLERLANKLGFDNDHIIAIGDSMNDYSMVNHFKYGVAMVNSKEDLLNIAKYVTKYDHNHDGVRRFIKKIIRNK